MTEITIKTECYCIQKHPKINKVLATINAKNIAKLLDVVGLTANPRKSKKNKITAAICDTLRTSPHDMRFKSKGLLISTLNCTQRERERFTLSFDDPNYEGVLDGGHNMLAVGLFILDEFFGDKPDPEFKKINNWDTFVEVWLKHKNELEKVLEFFEFEIPIEIIYPSEDHSEQFRDAIFEISDARNNNFALTAGTKADHKGYYKILKMAFDDVIKEEIEWKDGEGQRIKREDVVTMSLIPLLALQEAKALKEGVPTINPITFYSGKGKCVDTFSSFLEIYSDENNDNKISDKLFLSAISLLRDLPKLYDLIYDLFPRAYNDNSSGFGRMKCVKIYDGVTTGESYLSKPPLTKYYKQECSAKYPDGFIIPIFAGLAALMEVKGNEVKWKVDPEKFIQDNLSEGITMLVNTIKDNDYNPNMVGKSKGAYDSMSLMFKYLISSK